jgi:hypothetical protein
MVISALSHIHEQRGRIGSSSRASACNLSRRSRAPTSEGGLEAHPRRVPVSAERARANGLHETEVVGVRGVEGDMDQFGSSGPSSGQGQARD